METHYEGCCRKELEDDEVTVYSYRGDDWGLPEEERARLREAEGVFTILKSALEEPEVRVERGRLSRHRRGTVERRVPHLPDIDSHLADGGVTIDTPCGVDELSILGGGRAVVAWGLIARIFMLYMQRGALPEEDAFV